MSERAWVENTRLQRIRADDFEGGRVEFKQVLLDLISSLDQGEGVDFDTLLSYSAARVRDRDASDSALDELTEEDSCT